MSPGDRFTDGLLTRTAPGRSTRVWFTVSTRRLLLESAFVPRPWCLPRCGNTLNITVRLLVTRNWLPRSNVFTLRPLRMSTCANMRCFLGTRVTLRAMTPPPGAPSRLMLPNSILLEIVGARFATARNAAAPLVLPVLTSDMTLLLPIARSTPPIVLTVLQEMERPPTRSTRCSLPWLP